MVPTGLYGGEQGVPSSTSVVHHLTPQTSNETRVSHTRDLMPEHLGAPRASKPPHAPKGPRGSSWTQDFGGVSTTGTSTADRMAPY